MGMIEESFSIDLNPKTNHFPAIKKKCRSNFLPNENSAECFSFSSILPIDMVEFCMACNKTS